MHYKDYEITAEVQLHEIWSIDESGLPVSRLEEAEELTVTGYMYRHSKTGEDYFRNMAQADMKRHMVVIDRHLEELAR